MFVLYIHHYGQVKFFLKEFGGKVPPTSQTGPVEAAVSGQCAPPPLWRKVVCPTITPPKRNDCRAGIGQPQ
jgi:hypothetical protein